MALLLCVTPGRSSAQSKLARLQEIKLPMPHFRGVWWSAELQSRWLFSIQLTREHDLLVYAPNKNGEWPLVRVRRWWTKKPESAVLNILGWSSADAKNLDDLDTRLLVTQDGRYALPFSIARWRKSADAPAREPDTIVSVIDLEKWQVVGNLHTLHMGLGALTGVRMLGSKVLVLSGRNGDSSNSNVRYVSVSLPALEPGETCTTGLPSQIPDQLKGNNEGSQTSAAADCAGVLTAAGATSLAEMDDLTQAERRPLPVSLAKNEQFLGGSHYESSPGGWYNLNSVRSELSMWSPDGRKERERQSPSLLCENQRVQGPSWVCDCSIAGVLEVQHVLLTHCITKHDNFFGSQVWLRQWLSVFRSDDFSEVGVVPLSHRNEETKEVVTSVDGRAYVLAVSLGETLRIYEVPNRP
jgi:hypothetical protein